MTKKSKIKASEKPWSPPIKIARQDYITQADAAHIIGCSRQRILERIRNGSLGYAVETDALGNETRYCSIKEVQELKEKLHKAPVTRKKTATESKSA